MRGIHWGPVNYPHKWPVTRKPFDDVIMMMSGHQHPCYWRCCVIWSLTKYFLFLCYISVDEQYRIQTHIYISVTKPACLRLMVLLKYIYVLLFLISDTFSQFHYQYQSPVIGKLSCQTCSPPCNGWPGVGATLQISCIHHFAISLQSDRNTTYLLYIMYHHTPVKFECESKYIYKCYWKVQNTADGEINKKTKA